MKGCLFRTFNSYPFNFEGGLLAIIRTMLRGGEQFLCFLKNDVLRFHLILLFFDSSKCFFFEMFLIRSTIANLCPIMIHFNAFDFNECHSKEVISFF